MNRTPDDDTMDEPLASSDILAQAIERLPSAQPSRDLWPGVQTRISRVAQPQMVAAVETHRAGVVALSWGQLALAASLLMAVTVSLTWLTLRQPQGATGVRTATESGEAVVLAESEPLGSTSGGVQRANFADAQYDAAVADLEKILASDHDRLDPRTVLVIERNLATIDQAIREATAALNSDPANTYLNSHLADARRRKLELLRHATTLASTGGD